MGQVVELVFKGGERLCQFFPGECGLLEGFFPVGRNLCFYSTLDALYIGLQGIQLIPGVGTIIPGGFNGINKVDNNQYGYQG